MRALLAVVTVVAMVCAGCLTNTHRIPKKELVGLTQTPPEQRGQRVRVVQTFRGEEPPPAQRVDSGASVTVYTGVSPVRTRRARVNRGNKFPGKGLAKAKSDKAYVYIILAVLLGITLAATEGQRWSGWVELHPMHPVHLIGPRGEYAVVPLAHIDPQTAVWAQKALVRPSEGPWKRLERAPLSRKGLTYSILLGAADMTSADDSTEIGFFSHIQFGYFPVQYLGLQFDAGLGWRDNVLGETLFESRWSGELDVLPVSLGRLHGGVFGQAGVARRFEDGFAGADKRDMLLGGGVLVQVGLTTFLSLTARAGMMWAYGERAGDFTLGLSVY